MRQPKVLVADDSRTIRTLVRRTLADDGLDVILACDGLEAVDLTRRDCPDLVILDIQMPNMDGYEACEQILALSNPTTALPIVFLTNESARHLVTLGNQLGSYLPKPVCERVLLNTVRDLLRRSQQTLSCPGITV